MPLKEIKEELELSKTLWDEYKEVRDQMDSDYQYIFEYAGKPIFPKDESGWEQVRYNGASVIVNKALGLLASADVQNYIPTSLSKEMPDREKISRTEEVAIGSLHAADRNLDNEYINKKLQDLKAFYSIVRGGTVSLVWLYKKKGQIIHDLREYDPYNCLFQKGRFEYRYFEDTDFLREKYKNEKIKATQNSKKGQKEQTLCHEIWYPDEWAIIVEDFKLDGGKNRLNRIPVKLSTVGSVPLVYSEQYANTLKHAFVSALTNNRDIYDKISQTLSILASRAKDSGTVDIISPYDGTMTGGQTNVGAEKGLNSEVKGKVRRQFVHINVGAGEGQPFVLEPPTDQHLMSYLSTLFGMDVLGSIDPIAFGQSRHSGQSGALAAELRNAALEFLNPFKKCIEESYVFDTEEIIRQFVEKKFSKSTFRGFHKDLGMFREEISPSEITNKEYFECNISFDSLRDIAQQTGVGIQLLNAGLMSPVEILEELRLSKNPDKTIELYNAHLANQDPVNRYRNWAYAAEDEGTDESHQRAIYYFAMARELQMAIINKELNPLDMLGANKVPYAQNNPTTTPQTMAGKTASDQRILS